MKSKLLFFLIVLICILEACFISKEPGVLVAPGHNELLGYSPSRRVLSILWRIQLVNPDSNFPNIYYFGRAALNNPGTRVFVSNYKGTFFCIDTKAGELVWRKLLTGPFNAEVTVYKGVVYAGSEKGVLYALRSLDGKLLWSYNTRASLDGRPIVAGNVVLVAANTNTLFCVDTQTGEWRWTYSHPTSHGHFSLKGVSNPLVKDGVVYIGFSDGTLVKLSLNNGSLLASQKLVDNDDKFTDVDTDPLLVKDDLLIGASSRGVVALDSKDLQKKWIHTVDGISFMELNSGILYYTTYNAKVEALQLDTREVIWRYNGGRGSLGKPVIAGRWLIASSSEHSLLVLDRSSGTLVQVFDPGKGGVSTPTLRDDRVYWVSNGQVLYCMTLLQ